MAYGALGIPITVLGKVTHQSDVVLGAMVGRQLPIVALILPFYVMAVFGGRRSVRAMWPLLLVAGSSFGLIQFATSNFYDYKLTDIFASLGSLLITVGFLQVWKPAPDREFAAAPREIEAVPLAVPSTLSAAAPRISPWQGWVPWIIVAVVVVIWTNLNISAIGLTNVHWPGLDNRVFITLFGKPYAAIWAFKPLDTGTAILVANVIAALVFRISPAVYLGCVARTWRQIRLAVLTVALIMGLAFLMNYAGVTYTLGNAAAHLGLLFTVASAFLGWIAVALTGSDTSGNTLFGNLQVVAAKQLHLSPVLFAATNSSGGVMGKMISPQNMSTGAAVTVLKGQEGLIFRQTFKHSVVLTLLVALIAVLKQFVFPWVIAQ